jgi:protoheme ferro-lyase
VYVGMRYWHPFTEEAIEQVGACHIPKILRCSVDFSGFFYHLRAK